MFEKRLNCLKEPFFRYNIQSVDKEAVPNSDFLMTLAVR